MQLLKQFFNFYIDASIHVALSVCSLTWLSLLMFDLPYDEQLLCFVFYASVTGYNFVKYFGVAKFHYRRLTSKLKAIQIISFLSFMAMTYYGLTLQTHTLFFAVLFGVVTFFYAIPFLPERLFLDNQYNLRAIGGLKIYLIALVWSGVTVLLPLINNDYAITFDVVIIAIQRYVFVLVLMLPFEIRDLQYDSLRLSTVPQKIGVTQTKNLGILLLIVFVVLEFLKTQMVFVEVVGLVVVAICSGLLLLFSKIDQGKYYSAFWVEVLPIFWLVLFLLF